MEVGDLLVVSWKSLAFRLRVSSMSSIPLQGGASSGVRFARLGAADCLATVAFLPVEEGKWTDSKKKIIGKKRRKSSIGYF